MDNILPHNKYSRVAVEELMFLGDILAYGIVKTALKKQGKNIESVSKEDIINALNTHIYQAIIGFLGQDGAKDVIRRIRKKLNSMG